MSDAVSLRYALITPAWNEQAHLDRLILSVAAQTALPVRWVIVSDGSTDHTDVIVRSAAEKWPWISLLRLERASERNFSGKAGAVNAGYASLKDVELELIGNLDADVTLPPDYYEFLLGKFLEMPDLGVAGTPYIEDASDLDAHSCTSRFADLSHVSGQTQFFRRRCFEEVGGYRPIKQGAIDWVAVTTARMRGWKTRTFVERTFLHHRSMGTADRSVLRARLHQGEKDFIVGGHPGWQILRGVFQMRSRPFVLGGLCLIAGYLAAWARRTQSPVPVAVREFHRREQMERLRGFIRAKRSQS